MTAVLERELQRLKADFTRRVELLEQEVEEVRRQAASALAQFPKNALASVPEGHVHGASAGTIVVEDEGTVRGSAATLDFTGAGVTATFAGSQATITIPGGAGTADRIQDTDNDTYVDAEVGTDPDYVTLGIPAAGTIFQKFIKGAEADPRFQIDDDDIQFGPGSSALNTALRYDGAAGGLSISTPGGAAGYLKVNELKEHITNARVLLSDGTWVQSAFSLHAATGVLAAGVLTATQPWMVVTAQSGTSDDMDTLSPSGISAINGDFYLISPTDTYAITIRDNSASGGNIFTVGDLPIVLDAKEKVALLLRFGTAYYAMPLFDNTTTGAIAPSSLNATGTFQLSGNTDVTWASQQDNFDPGTNSIINVSLTGSQTLTGVSGGTDGRILIIQSRETAGTDVLTIADSSGSSTLGNRFQLNEGDLKLGPSEGAVFQWRVGGNAWYCFGRYLQLKYSFYISFGSEPVAGQSIPVV